MEFHVKPRDDDWEDALEVQAPGHKEALEELLEHYWDHYDGPSWMKDGFRFDVRDSETKKVVTFYLSVDWSPVFHVSTNVL